MEIFGCKYLVFNKQIIFISLLLNDIYCTAQNGILICTFRSHFLHLNHQQGNEIMKIKIFILQFEDYSKNSKTKQDIEKLKTPLRLAGNVVLNLMRLILDQRFFRRRGTLNSI